MVDDAAPQRARAQLREFRRIVANAVGELRSQDIRDTYAALSVEELIDQHIARLETTDDALHPSRLQRIAAVKAELSASIDAMKAVPPEQFRSHVRGADVNTEEGGEDGATTRPAAVPEEAS